ncbi:helix-turn-helix transcriptional regulator [Serratia marcescens]|uniref:helix-turn-helix transcriptional regulator n=1 Tax=Serratia marcescens TaxID=615 RepID=UPI00148D8DB3|nr:LuxR C-terminal-related transcriptional regulator [Serratia marcescens]QJU42300.1 hypothetical protein HMI62_24650 [Serratia marcescens]
MKRKTNVRIDTQNNYLSEALKRVMEAMCQEHFPLKFISKEDKLRTASVIITREIRTIIPKKIFPWSYGQPIIVQLRDTSAYYPVVLHPCAMQGLCIFRDDSVDTVSSVINQALHIHSSQLAPAKYCSRCKPAHITQAEQQFLFYFLKGRSPVEISVLTGCNIKTVSTQKRCLMKKLNIETDWELFHYFNNGG